MHAFKTLGLNSRPTDVSLALVINLVVLGQGGDYLPQGKQRLVDSDGLLQLVGVTDLPFGFDVGLAFAPGKVDQLELGDYHIFRVFDVNLAHDKAQNAMTPATALIYAMASHHLVLESFPEILKTVIGRVALKLVDILNLRVVIGSHSYLESGDTIQHALIILNLIQVRIKQIVNFLVVKLNILACNSNLVSVC